MIRLYRSCPERDKTNGFRLTSRISAPLTSQQVLEETVSHVLNSETARGVLYSFSPDLSLVRAFHARHPEQHREIRYIDVELDKLPAGLQSAHPVFQRDYLLYLMCQAPDALNTGVIVNPATGRLHSLLGIINLSERAVAGWSAALEEIVLVCKDLPLQPLPEDSTDINQKQQVEAELRAHFFRNPPEKAAIERLRAVLEEQFLAANCRRSYMLERVRGDDWYVA